MCKVDTRQLPFWIRTQKRTHEFFRHKNYALKNAPKSLILNDNVGAGDEIRTHDIYLGKVTQIIIILMRIICVLLKTP